ncbi:MAG TPA: ATPase, T2SS/T4P/T4SS family [Planctomycetia bacterium]|nr:ATPase, T2SS/T4P/T4SS family [Planctomycetia bacterium]
MRIEDLLLRNGVLTPDQLADAKRIVCPGKRLDQAVVELGFADEDSLLKLMGGSLGLEVVSVQDAQVGADVLQLVPSRTVFKHQVFPLARNNGSLKVATSNPFDIFTLDELHEATGLHIEPVLAPQREIAVAIKNHFGVGGETVGAMVGDRLEVLEDQQGEGGDELAEEASVIKLVNEILFEAIEQRTSDIHIEPLERGLRIRYRIDGILQVQALPQEIHRFAPAIVSRLKIMARLNIAEKRLPQDGRIQLRVRGREVDIRVSIIPMTFGEGVVLRVLDKSRMQYDLKAIGMEEDHYAVWRQLIDLPHGILLVTGPTGSGKSTTLYSALQEIASEDIKIITVEDPVEYQISKIQQIQVHTKIGLTFSSGLRSILRHDPDVILIGEIRDLETAEIAMQSALTGHLVFSTLHTNDASGAFTRLTDMGVEPFLVASTVEAVLAQRLVRMICKECREAYAPDPLVLPEDIPGRGDPDLKLYRGKGCRACNQTGYRGRKGIFELLPISDPLRHLVTERSSSAIIKSEALREGLVTLRQDGWRKLLDGRTTLEEVIRITKSDEGIKLVTKEAAT